MDKYFTQNKRMWNDRVHVHMKSEKYDLPSFLAGASSLKDIELKLLGDVKGKSILHLQCHFGMDSLSLSRMGAKVCGIDFSDKAIEEAKKLNEKLGLDAEFICCDVLKIDEYISAQYDIIFTTYGTIGWLPELTKWGKLIRKCLKPGGRFVFAEFHPIVWMYDDAFKYIQYGYFNSGPITEQEIGSYADKNADLNHESTGWNHAIAEVLQALLSPKMQLISFDEYPYSPFDIFNDSTPVDGGVQIKGLEDKLPLVYSIVMEKLS